MVHKMLNLGIIVGIHFIVGIYKANSMERQEVYEFLQLCVHTNDYIDYDKNGPTIHA